MRNRNHTVVYIYIYICGQMMADGQVLNNELSINRRKYSQKGGNLIKFDKIIIIVVMFNII